MNTASMYTNTSANTSHVLRVRLRGLGVLAPGLADWAQCAACLRGEAPYQPAATVLPAPDMLPPAERRRASRVPIVFIVKDAALSRSGSSFHETGVATGALSRRRDQTAVLPG